MAPVIRWLDHFTTAGDAAWSGADSEQEFARALFAESRRLLLACNAMAAAAPTLGAAQPLTKSIDAALAARHQWFVDQLETLRSAPLAVRDADAERAATSATLHDLGTQLAELDAPAVASGGELPPFTVPNSLLEITLDIPGGWLLVRNRIDIVLAAPPEQQLGGVRGLGVPGWNFGTALRVRRFRHESPWTLADTADLVDSLLTRFGARTSDGPARVDGLEALTRVYEAPDDGWITIVAATVHDLQTYLFELGCPVEQRASCDDLLQGFLEGVRFSDG